MYHQSAAPVTFQRPLKRIQVSCLCFKYFHIIVLLYAIIFLFRFILHSSFPPKSTLHCERLILYEGFRKMNIVTKYPNSIRD